jgi:hypothetical protein
MVYKFKSGNTFQGANAQEVGEELERIRVRSGGKLRTEDVVKEARSDNSPLHKMFLWDDEKAAHEHRLQQARQLIRVVVIVEDQMSSPAFWNVRIKLRDSETNEQYYQSAEVVSQSPIEYEAALKTMLRELSSAQSGLEHLRRIAPRGKKQPVRRALSHVASAQQALA